MNTFGLENGAKRKRRTNNKSAKRSVCSVVVVDGQAARGDNHHSKSDSGSTRGKARFGR